MGTKDTNVFVVGGGPAGLAAAIAAQQQGMRVMLADYERPPVDKACGEGLMPDSAAALAALGVSLEGVETFAFRGIRFVGPESATPADFPVGRGLGIRRTVLHRLLVERAQQLGIEMLWGTRVSGISERSVVIDGRRIECNWIVGADGQNSRVRAWAGLNSGRQHDQRIGLRRHFEIEPWSEYVEIYWGEHSQVYVTPIARRAVCVAMISRTREDFTAALERFPSLAQHLRGATPLTSVKGAPTITRSLRRVCRGNVALIGEASGSADAITGEGLALAFRQAVCLAAAIASSDLMRYQVEHRRIASHPQRMGRAMLLMDKNGWVRRQMLRAFDRTPALFQRLLSLHLGNTGLRAFGIDGALQLGWSLLTA